MDRNEREIIDGLFGKIQAAERQTGPRDAEAEGLISQHLSRQPAAPYYMAQAILVQEQALNAAQARIQELERELQSRPAAASGGFLSGIFGGAQQARPAHQQVASPWGQSAQQPSRGPWGAPPMGHGHGHGYGRPGGGFMGGALQTALAVGGGIVAGSLIADMLTPDAAQAAEPEAEPAAEEGFQEDPSAGEDFGGEEF